MKIKLVKQSTEIEASSAKLERKRGRPPAGTVTFPRNSLAESLRIAETIEKENAGQPFDPILIAKSMGTTSRSGGFDTLARSSERYGLTIGQNKSKSISLTGVGSAIVAPTDDSTIGTNLRTALMTPSVFQAFYSKYDRKNLPKPEIALHVLEKEFNVPRVDVEVCYKTIMQNVEDYKLSMQSGQSKLLYLDNLGKASTAIPISNEGSSQLEQLEAQGSVQEDQEKYLQNLGRPETAAEPEQPIPRVFISHSKNKKILDQIKQMLDFGKFQYDIAEERETTAIPIPEKVFGLMRNCNCAVINVSADEQEKKEDGNFGVNQNVLTEIGAAFLAYEKRVILLVDKRVKLPSNLQGLYASYYEGDELSWETGMKLQKALTEFRSKL